MLPVRASKPAGFNGTLLRDPLFLRAHVLHVRVRVFSGCPFTATRLILKAVQ